MIRIIKDDITTLKVDAIVNAANTTLMGGGGVDGAIHRAAGPGLLEECRRLGGCPVGEARITSGYRLPARYVIHTVGPIWQGRQGWETEFLRSCYNECLELARKHGLKSIAFPCISTGVYGYPHLAAARIALETIFEYQLAATPDLDVTICCFTPVDFDVYATLGTRCQIVIGD